MCKGLLDVDMDKGNPMEYLIAKGVWAVKQAVRTVLNHEIIEECLTCGKRRPYRQEKCYTCHGLNFVIHPRYIELVIKATGEIEEPERTQARWRGI